MWSEVDRVIRDELLPIDEETFKAALICTEAMMGTLSKLYPVPVSQWELYLKRFEDEEKALTPEEYTERVSNNPNYGKPVLVAFVEFRKKLEELRENASIKKAAVSADPSSEDPTG